MGKPKPLPRNCLVVKTYREFHELLNAFASGAYQLMCILGGPGLGKSETLNRTMQQSVGSHGWGLIKGKHTPLDLYERLLRFRSLPIILDDLDDLLRQPANVIMLKCVCDAKPVKRVEWGSTHAAFQFDLPKSFDSISRVCLVANDWNALDRNIGAIYDRGIVISFQPSALEVHKELANSEWFDDTEVFEFIGRNLFLVVDPSFRFYQTAKDHKQAGLDWRDLVLRTIEGAADEKLILVARLLADPNYDTLSAPELARVQAFHSLGGGTKATYYRYKADLLRRRGNFNLDEVAAIKLQPPRLDLHFLALRDRREQLEQLRNGQNDQNMVDQKGPIDGPEEANADPLARLHRDLKKAISQENYELAAKLRDAIRQAQEPPDKHA